MTATPYDDLVRRRDKLRPSVVAEPTWTQGVIWPSPFLGKGESAEEVLTKGVKAWVRIAMANIITAGDALGWDRFINALDRVQRPASYKKAKRLQKEFNIQGSCAASGVNTMVTWARGDLFSDFVHPLVSEHELMGVGTWCPQVDALEEMGMGDRGKNLRLWCDTYDSFICQPINEQTRMVHANCPAAGDKYCMFYIFEEETPKAADYYGVIKHFNDKKGEPLKKNPNPDYTLGFGPPRFHDGLPWTESLKDGMVTKASIALQSMLVAGLELGWQELLEKIMAEHTWGYREEAMKMRRDYGIKTNTVRDAGALLAIGYGLNGFDGHSLIAYTPEVVEGISETCQVVEAAEALGVTDKLPDMGLWCDFYHNHKVHAVNEKLNVTHTHCLARGDKYCRFCVK